MKKIFLAVLPALMVACGTPNEPTTELPEAPAEKAAEACVYAFEEGSAEVIWTSFKLTKRAPVKGKFDSVVVTGTQTSGSAAEVFAGAGFEIYVSSINSNEPVRDGKLMKNFFGNMANTEVISGSVANIDGKQAKIQLKLNDQTLDIDGQVTVEGDMIELRTNVDVSLFGAQAAVDSLNAVCLERHTGDDGVSKLWPDADVLVSAKVVKACE